MIDCYASARATVLVFTTLADEERASNLKLPLRLAIINKRTQEFVGNTVEIGAFQLAQADVIAFPSHRRAFRGLAIVDSFNAHIELLRKSWVLNNPMPNRFTQALLHAST